ncbi:transcription antitermination factor NusB [Lysinibacter sp. HNR]|uniref:RsmB/NOP family class I SAM-dependent RNA methyltransferase n=1 Tax=Lysinibacter sp. HNR TaxID=3031408 RepID=UPI002435B978|nr:transcription antitermination factor NusB [Lysinibacter sp. HNR]WGD36361.1 transcription antitermination factor NusB [Lysinibacter sp. HNR]
MNRDSTEKQSTNASQERSINARLLAYEVLAEVRDSDAYANLVLPSRLRSSGLDSSDRGFATELVYGTLRMQGYYDRVIERVAGRDLHTIDPVALVVLRMGAHQILGMRTPVHAAVYETVDIQKRVGRQSAVGFVNGVLRSLGRRQPEEWLEDVLGELTNADARLSAQFSHPEWVIRAFRASLRAEGRAEEIKELLTADNRSPRVSLVTLPGSPKNISQDTRATASTVSPLGHTLERGDPSQVTGPSNGWIRVQDQGSQVAALILTRAREVEEGEMWLDMCAGPGGKSAILGAEARLGGAHVIANEVVPARANLVRKSVIAVQDAVDVVVGEGQTIPGRYPEGFHRIMVDAPCTGLGALRRRPEARWRKDPTDIPPLTSLQDALLEAAVTALKPGGLLAYVTCSPHRAETRTVVNGMLKKHPQMTELSAREILQRLAPEPVDLGVAPPREDSRGGGKGDSSNDGKDSHGNDLSVQLWPHRHGTDAMFVSLFKKLG